MFRNLRLVSSLPELRFTPNSTCNVSVRWRRKPRWLPVARSKMFRIPERPNIPEDENREMLRLNNIYRTQMRGIKTVLIEELKRAEAAEVSSRLGSESEDAELARGLALNEAWNRDIEVVRAARLAQQAQARSEKAIRGLSAHEEKVQQKREEVEATVRAEQALAGSYITADKLDAAIEAALGSTADYNFSIDLNGNVVHGRDSRSVSKTTEPSAP